MKKKQTPVRIIFLLLLVHLLVSMVIWFATAPQVEKRGEKIQFYYMPTTINRYLDQIEERRGDDELIQYIYRNPIHWNPENPLFLRQNDRDIFFLGATVKTFARSNTERVIISVPYMHDVYEVDITRSEFETFVGQPLNEIDAINLIYSLVEQNKQREFFKTFGRIY